MMRLALARVLADRIHEDAVTIVDQLSVSEPKTRAFAEILKQLKVEGKVLVIVENPSKELILASRNIPSVELVSADKVTVYQVASNPRVLVTQSALDVIKSRICAEKDAV